MAGAAAVRKAGSYVPQGWMWVVWCQAQQEIIHHVHEVRVVQLTCVACQRMHSLDDLIPQPARQRAQAHLVRPNLP